VEIKLIQTLVCLPACQDRRIGQERVVMVWNARRSFKFDKVHRTEIENTLVKEEKFERCEII